MENTIAAIKIPVNNFFIPVFSSAFHFIRLAFGRLHF